MPQNLSRCVLVTRNGLLHTLGWLGRGGGGGGGRNTSSSGHYITGDCTITSDLMAKLHGNFVIFLKLNGTIKYDSDHANRLRKPTSKDFQAARLGRVR